jgi:hypothetical protein
LRNNGSPWDENGVGRERMVEEVAELRVNGIGLGKLVGWGLLVGLGRIWDRHGYSV